MLPTWISCRQAILFIKINILQLSDLEKPVKYPIKSTMIIAIIISYRQANGSFFQRTQERLIPWQQIAIIGTDIILIKDNPLPQEAKEKTQEIYSMNEES